jgi:UDP-N-acetylmuramoyl-tripeptide--D-alanyl-D-alanine ligase
MSLQASLQEILLALELSRDRLTNAQADLTEQVIGITTDTRAIARGQVFLALRGDKFDGHDFVATAIQQGATAAIVDEQFSHPQSAQANLIVVPNTLKAYQQLGHWWRKKFDIPVIGITGSVGKTTTKELIAAALGHYGNVLKTQANYNNEIGVPKTLLELRPDHNFAVIEMGMRGLGQIAELARIAEPTIGLVTYAGLAHVELLGSAEAIAQAKCELFAEMPQDGIAVWNQDQPRLVEYAEKVWSGRTIGYGFNDGATVQGKLIDLDTLEIDGLAFPLTLPGEHNALNYLGTMAVLQALGLDRSPLTAGLAVDLPSGRAKRFELPGDIVLLDETYNAGLESMLAALKLLAQTQGTRRIAVLGTMKELGDYSLAFHQQVGEAVTQLGIDALLILADPAEAAALQQGAQPLVAACFADQESLIATLKTMVQPGDRILFKASRAVGLDRVVAALRGTEA